MKWEPGDKYYIHCATHTICRVSTGHEWIYELWEKGTRKRVAERRAKTYLEGKAVTEELKGLVNGL